MNNLFKTPFSTSAHLGGSLAIAVLLLTTVATPASSAIVMTAVESGDDVVISFSGTLDITGLTPFATDTFGSSRMRATDSLIHFRGTTGSLDSYSSVFSSSPFSIGAGALTSATSSAGDVAFGVSRSNLWLERNTDSTFWQSTRSGSMTFANNTLAGLGITPGTYNWVLNNTAADTITLTATQAVPEPSSLVLFGGGGVAFACAAYRRRVGMR
jgi:hypothetical protein